jgi:hypothetical protein
MILVKLNSMNTDIVAWGVYLLSKERHDIIGGQDTVVDGDTNPLMSGGGRTRSN